MTDPYLRLFGLFQFYKTTEKKEQKKCCFIIWKKDSSNAVSLHEAHDFGNVALHTCTKNAFETDYTQSNPPGLPPVHNVWMRHPGGLDSQTGQPVLVTIPKEAILYEVYDGEHRLVNVQGNGPALDLNVLYKLHFNIEF